MIRRFVHFGVLCTAKYLYGENRVANPNFKKNHFYTLKVKIVVYNGPRAFFKRIPKFAFLGEKSSKLATLI
jgi:hypothetical protein